MKNPMKNVVSMAAAVVLFVSFNSFAEKTKKEAPTKGKPAKHQKHDGHVDYEHDGHHHKAHGDHDDECDGPEHKAE